MLKRFLVIVLIVITVTANGYNQSYIIPSYNMSKYDKEINKIYQKLPPKQNNNIAQRVDIASHYFLGRKYLLTALGEGTTDEFDQKPLYRTDVFDCFTFTDTVLALAISNDLDEFKQNINRLRYKNNLPIYRERNHFVSIDWNPNNAAKGYIKDITKTIISTDGKPLAITTNTFIDKKAWYRKKTVDDIKLLKPVPFTDLHKRVAALQQQSQYVTNQYSYLPYIELKQFFDEKGKPKMELLQQIPNGAIIEIVRPNWQVKDYIGTNLDVSHIGFAVYKKGKIYFRHASPVTNQVTDVLLTSYMQKYLWHPTVRGINITQING